MADFKFHRDKINLCFAESLTDLNEFKHTSDQSDVSIDLSVDRKEQAIDFHQVGRKALYQLLHRREYSRFELTRKLQQKAVPIAIANELIDDFIAQGYQSDSRFAQSFVRSKANKGFGPLKIRAELNQHGIGVNDFDIAVKDNEIDWLAHLFSVYEKKFGEHPPADFEAKQKANRFLIQRGFSHDLIYRLFKELA